MKKSFVIKKILGCIIVALIFCALAGYVVMLLWNNVLTGIISVPVIGFWQAVGLLLLCKILFGGIHGRWGGKCGCGGGWKRELGEKWQHMSQEEREKIKQEWKERCRRF